MISRRSFLLGIGSLVTNSFVARARAHVRESGSPLLLQPKGDEETLYLYYWDHHESPQAKAHQLLTDLNLDCDPKEPGRKAGNILFTERGGHPGSSERWVDLKDDLSVSILQARLIERDLPIKLVLGSL